MTHQQSEFSTIRDRFKRSILALFVVGSVTSWQISIAQQTPMVAPSTGQPCQINIDQEVIDYGSFTAGQLSRTSQNSYSLDPRHLRVSVSCPAKTLIALRLTGPSSSTGNAAPKFATGGSVRVTLSDPVMDGEPVGLRMYGRNNAEQRSLDLLTNETVQFSTKNGDSIGSNLSARIRIEPMVEHGETRTADQTVWTSQLRFELITQ